MAKDHNKYGDVFRLIVSKENIYSAFSKSLEGDGKYTLGAMEFVQDETYNIRAVTWDLIKETYTFDGYYNFITYEPKERNIHAPKEYKDKLVQLAVSQVLNHIYNQSFISDSYACIEDKGTHACVDKIQEMMRRASWEYGEETVAIKCDISNFFASIDRDILKLILSKQITCQKTMRLLYKLIDSANEINPIGLPLGNPTSQNFANIYMNELDQYCKRVIGLKYYVRYMDDFFIFVENKEEARRVLGLIKTFIEGKLNMKLNEDKTKHFPVDQGLNAIGFKIYKTHRLLRDDSKKKIKRKIGAMPRLIIENKLSISKAEQILNSWKGHAEHGNSHNFIIYLLNRYDFLYLVVKGDRTVLKIDINKLYNYYDNQANQRKLANQGKLANSSQPKLTQVIQS